MPARRSLFSRRITHDIRRPAFYFKKDAAHVFADDTKAEKLHRAHEQDDDDDNGPAGWIGMVYPHVDQQPDEKQLKRVEAIINSMTPEERRKQHIINGSRRKRIAKGSGTSVEDVNRLLKHFVQMQKMLKSLGGLTGLAGGGKKARRRAMDALRSRSF